MAWPLTIAVLLWKIPTSGSWVCYSLGMAAGGSTKAVLAALLANLAIAIAKFVGYVITRSASMLAEAVHSCADTGNQALLLLGGRLAKREPTPRHPFGYGRERYFWSFVVTIILFTLGALFAINEGIEKLRHPHKLESLGIAIGILIFGIVVESLSFRTAIVESNRVRGKLSWGTFIRRSRTPELPVVLLEDLGAMLGMVIALVAVVLAEITGEPRWDGAGTLAIGVLLGLIAIVLAIEMKSLLIGESATAKDRARLRAALEQSPEVDKVVDLRTQHLGPEELLVAAEVDFADHLPNDGIPAAVAAIEAHLRAEVPAATRIYLEPSTATDSN
ncbi:cation diffusion facilitator family transporter [Candidatus Poriferisocius sp.]|uniref:cation diffusion facilitator family transporter n=1 Tax=Candidatus Poriferisocius sp. TaxID=3101276 RepID=UPI003B0244B1